MSENLKREIDASQRKIEATIEMACVSVEALCSGDVVPKLDLDLTLPAAPEGELPRVRFETELPVLGFSDSLLQVDGYMAAHILSAMPGEPWFIFGSFQNQNGKRYHIVLPRAQVPKCLAVLDWEILGWTKRELHRF